MKSPFRCFRNFWNCLHLLWLVAGLLARPICQAEPTAAVPVKSAADAVASLADLIKEAYERNPGIQSARSQWKAAIEKYPQAVALPDPVLGYAYYARSVETRVGPQRHRLSLKQKLPYPGKLRLKGEIVRQNIEIARLNYEKATRDVIVTVKSSFYELSYLNAAIELTKQNQDLLNHVLKIATARYAEDKTTLNDVLRAQAQVAQLQYDLITLKELAMTETTKLNALLDRSPERALSLQPVKGYRELRTALQGLYDTAVNRRQEIQIAQRKVARGDRAIELARKRNRPDFSLDVMYVETGDALRPTPDDGKDPVVIGMSLNIPIWGTRNRSRVFEASHARHAAALSLKELQNRTMAAVKTIYFKLENSRRLIELYRDNLIPQGKKSMEISESWYRDGKGSFSDFLETQSVWLNFNLAYQRALADYYLSLARMEQITGGSID